MALTRWCPLLPWSSRPLPLASYAHGHPFPCLHALPRRACNRWKGESIPTSLGCHQHWVRWRRRWVVRPGRQGCIAPSSPPSRPVNGQGSPKTYVRLRRHLLERSTPVLHLPVTTALLPSASPSSPARKQSCQSQGPSAPHPTSAPIDLLSPVLSPTRFIKLRPCLPLRKISVAEPLPSMSPLNGEGKINHGRAGGSLDTEEQSKLTTIKYRENLPTSNCNLSPARIASCLIPCFAFVFSLMSRVSVWCRDGLYV